MKDKSAKKTLIIVDFQFDFCHPDGKLYVEGTDVARTNLIEMLKHSSDISEVLFTLDWHKSSDESFKENGGIWPVHCVQGTKGSEVAPELLEVCEKKGIATNFFEKGTTPSHEEYGAFETISKIKEGRKTTYILRNFARNGVKITNTNLIVAGIAGDYCVSETIKNLLKCKDFNVEVYKEGIASIDNGETLAKTVKDNNLKYYKPEQ